MEDLVLSEGVECGRNASQDGSGPRISITNFHFTFYCADLALPHVTQEHYAYAKTFERVKKTKEQTNNHQQQTHCREEEMGR